MLWYGYRVLLTRAPAVRLGCDEAWARGIENGFRRRHQSSSCRVCDDITDASKNAATLDGLPRPWRAAGLMQQVTSSLSGCMPHGLR